ncbi:EamA family transporter, partial [Patescibacteria group bacterium]
FINVILVSFAQILLKIGTGKVEKIFGEKNIFISLSKIFSNPQIFIGTSLYVISLILWLYILSRSRLSMAYPIMSMSYIFVMVLSIYFLKENVGLMQWLGAFLVITGISLIFISK